MKSSEIRRKYLEFQTRRGYKKIAPVDLILRDDPTTLFTGSGMQPMVPYLLGQEHPNGDKLTNCQPCIRTQDMEEVGDNRHTTFFEMLGDWSLDGFDKEEQLRFSFDFLIKELKLDPKKIFVSCFIGDKEHGIPRDNETAEIWQKLFQEVGIEAKIAEIGSAKNGDERGIFANERIFFYDDKENWWSRNGGISTTPKGDPCGPDSEFFYDFGESAHDPSFGKAHPASDSGRFIEIGNKVFMQYRRLENGEFEELAKGKIDQGDGLSRLAAATLDTPDIFKTDLYQPIIARLEQLSGKKYDFSSGDLGYETMPDCWKEIMASMRVIADHLTGAVWLASQNLTPSNKEQGYVMRRLLRRAIRFAFDLGIEQNFLEEIVPVIIDIYAPDYPHMESTRDNVIAILAKEEKTFRQTLKKGLREFEKLTKNARHEDRETVAQKPIIAVDIDDVLSDTAHWFIDETKKHWGEKVREENFSENWGKAWGIDEEKSRQRHKEIIDDLAKASPIDLENSREVLKKLKEKFSLHVLTSRSKTREKLTRNWIEKYYDGIFDEIHVASLWDVNEGSKKSKADFCESIRADFLIDDNPKHVNSLGNCTTKGILFGNNSWLQKDYKKLATDVTWAKNWQEVQEYFAKILAEYSQESGANILTGAEIFTLYDTFGFPVELSVEEAFKRDIAVSENWHAEFDELMQKQREMSQTAAKGTFKGGLGGQTWQHRRYHTATHLLQSALREIFGPDLRQHGSNITEERLRFDFNLDHKMTTDEIQKAEDLVNDWILKDLPIWWREYPTAEALKMGAIGPFGERYAETVKVYQMGADDEMVSLEICGGPHLEHTGQLATRGELNDEKVAKENGFSEPDNSTDAPENSPIAHKTDFSKIKNPAKFKIVKEESSAAGIRRIKAILE